MSVGKKKNFELRKKDVQKAGLLHIKSHYVTMSVVNFFNSDDFVCTCFPKHRISVFCPLFKSNPYFCF